MSSKPIRAAVLGVGFSATVFQIPFILGLPDQFKLHSILERRATKEQSKARDLYGHTGVKVVTTYDDVLQDPEVDLVVVSIRSPEHFAYTKAALEAGKHVILEKPVTATSADMRELTALAKSKQLVLAPYHNRRFDGDFRTVRALIKDGKLPDLIDFESRFDVLANWPMGLPGTGSGISYGLGTHLLDQVIALFGKPKSVTAMLINARGIGHPEVEDSFILHLRYVDSPVIVTLRSVMHSVMSKQVRFVARSLNASYVKYGLDVQADQLMQQSMKATDSGFGEEPKEKWGEYGRLVDGKQIFEKIPTHTGSYLDYYRNVGEAIRGVAQLEVTPEDAELGIRIIEVARQSSQEGRTIEFE
ncbi:NAD binding Rossmann fold oxidoreductase [Calocera viscosa TUFC12733]|uniref:NAD binding Rossmann fold oxidoreductase n=1 Tax=Calocera viscosa (strain TUFC12733) TaxID=1330018 RepID=A0A167MIB8_CALVF|nr:NAD binding Rossmann fold oxidoreductase [Calocera viscosa TUFC12733]